MDPERTWRSGEVDGPLVGCLAAKISNGCAMSLEIKASGGVQADIDRIDGELLRLLNERAQRVMDAAQIRRAGSAEDPIAYRAEQEAQLLRKVVDVNAGPVSGDAMRNIFVEIMSACRALELPLSVAYLGPSGTYSEVAVFKHFGHGVETQSQGSIDGVFREVDSGRCEFGVVPIENSTEGVVNHTLDTFVNCDLSICGEVQVPIDHCLLSNAKALGDVRLVYSHQQSLAQCRKWLDANLPGVPREAVSSNAEAARLVADAPSAAGIASKTAGDTYGVGVLASNISDVAGNTTRFLVIGKDQVAPSGDDKTSVMFYWSRDVPGGLYKAIEVFARAGMNMTRIESRPSRLQRWNYIFHVDFVGHRDEPDVRSALKELEARTDFCKVIGSFPRAIAEDLL
ncbi:MAG: chorismate mutase/prephenate dehydratase [Gammaproteobacteria bacterium]